MYQPKEGSRGDCCSLAVYLFNGVLGLDLLPVFPG